jgi:hypothetical protein
MRFLKYFVAAGALVTSFAGTASADETATPGRTTIKTVVVVGNSRRPNVTIDVTRQKLSVPLHEMKHPLDEKAAASSAPF